MPAQAAVIRKVKDTISRQRLLEKGDSVLIGVSGGPDSVCLLYVLNSLKDELGISLNIAHLDHGLRRNSVRDRRSVESLAARLNIRAVFKRAKISRRGSLEESARLERINFLVSQARRIRADKIALGHNLDDQAETVLMRVIRGTGLYGLAAILPKRNINGACFIRPLLDCSRREINNFLKRRKIHPCLDESNLKDDFLRNRIRNRLLPLLERDYNRKIKESLSSLAQSAGYDYEYLQSKKRLAARKFSGVIDIRSLKKLPVALERLILRDCYARLKGDLRRLEFCHIRQIEQLIHSHPSGSRVALPAGITVVKRKSKKNLDKLIFLS